MSYWFPKRDMTEREINALRLDGALSGGRVHPWWMHGEEWKRAALKRYDEMCAIFKKAGE
jgi:hypothetical protein